MTTLTPEESDSGTPDRPPAWLGWMVAILAVPWLLCAACAAIGIWGRPW